jgi:CRISPR-associated protein Cas1
LELAAEAAADLQLRLNEEDTAVVAFDEGVRFCGEVVTATTGAVPEAQAHPLQGTVFVTTEGALLRTRGDRLRVEDGDRLLVNLNLKRVRQVVCAGRVGVTSGLVQRAARDGIDLVWLFDDGRYAGGLDRLERGDPELRLAQYRVADDNHRALRLAHGFVAGKITNLRVGMLRAARGRDQPELAEHSGRLESARRSALRAGSRMELMGCEGAASRDYFDALGRILGPEWAFHSRQRRPPPDPVNAMLSFGYTLLTSEAVAACELAGLDPFLGFLHGPRRSRPSLALDLIEELRPVVVDATLVRLARVGQVTPADFTATDGDGCRMTDPARRAFLAAYEQRMLTLVFHPAEGRRLPWRQVLAAQARQVAAVLTGRAADYQPVVWR